MPRMTVTDTTLWPLYIAIAKDHRTQHEIAREVGRSNCWLSKVMHGLTAPSDVDRRKIAEVLGRNENELFSNKRKVIVA